MLDFITWMVRPDIFVIGGHEIRWYGLFFALAFYLGVLIISKMFKQENVPEKWVDSLFIYVIIATVIGARLGHVFFYGWDYYSQNLSEIPKIWHGGLASHGGALGIILSIWLYSKYVTHRSMLWTLDRLMVPIGLAAFFIRMGNLMNHEIYGHATSLPWGFRFVTNIRAWQMGATPIFSMPSHPTQIYEALSYFITFLIMLYMYYKIKDAKDRPGLMFGVFIIIVFSSRFFIEFIKNDQEAFESGMFLNMGQWLSIPFVLFGIYFVWHALKNVPKYYKAVKEDK